MIIVVPLIAALIILLYLQRISSAIGRLNRQVTEHAPDERFTVMPSKHFMAIGIIVNIIFAAFLIGFTDSGLIPDMISKIMYYIFCIIFLVIGTYLILRSVKFKVVVTGEEISVFPIFSEPYTFFFDDIVLASRKVTKNAEEKRIIDSSFIERDLVIITTADGKKLQVDNSDLSYGRFVIALALKVDRKNLSGFF